MRLCLTSKARLAEFVKDLLPSLTTNSAWTMTIRQEPSEEFCAITVIDELSEDSANQWAQHYLEWVRSILKNPRQDL